MFARVQELKDILIEEFGVKPSKVSFVYENKAGEWDRETLELGVNDKKLIEEYLSKVNHVYGYHMRTADGTVYDFWFDGKSYHLVGLEIGNTDIPIEQDSRVYKSNIIKAP